MIRKILAVIAGAVTAVVLTIAIEKLGHIVYPVPPDIDFADPSVAKAYIDGLPVGALLFVSGAWFIATLAGGVIASAIARETPFTYSAIVGGLVLLGTVLNLLWIPHPLWFSIMSVAGIIACVFIAARIGAALTRPPAHE